MSLPDSIATPATPSFDTSVEKPLSPFEDLKKSVASLLVLHGISETNQKIIQSFLDAQQKQIEQQYEDRLDDNKKLEIIRKAIDTLDESKEKKRLQNVFAPPVSYPYTGSDSMESMRTHGV